MKLFLIAVLCALFVGTMGYMGRPTQLVKAAATSKTSLFAHHVNAKVTKKMMKNRPKKHRLSDINRKNVNLHKCITKVENAPAEYTLMSAEGTHEEHHLALYYALFCHFRTILLNLQYNSSSD
jgi:hypothetical protein